MNVQTGVENRLICSVIADNAALGTTLSNLPMFAQRSVKTRRLSPMATNGNVKTAMTLAYSDIRMRPADIAEWELFQRTYKYGSPDCCDHGSHNHLRWRIIHRFYLELGWNARKVVNLQPDDWMLSQHTIYIYANKIRRACSIAEPDRVGNNKVDWELAQELLDEGMTDAELRSFFKVAHNTLEYSPLHAKKPRRRYGGLRGR